jgi:hypothetical protein
MAGQPVCMDILSSASLAVNEAPGRASAVASSSSFNIRRGTCSLFMLVATAFNLSNL